MSKDSTKPNKVVNLDKDDNPDDYIKTRDGTHDDTKEAWMNLVRQSESPFGFQFNDDGTSNPTPPKIVYKPTEKISDEDWKAMKEHYLREFEISGFDPEGLDMIKGHLNSAWEWWEKGAYPNIDKFVDALDNQFQGYADMLKKRQKKSFTDIEGFDILNDEWGDLANQLRWDDSAVDDLLKEEVVEKEEEIKAYFRQRIDHGLEITDEMREFKGLDEFTRERVPELIQKYSLEPIETLPEGCPPVEPVDNESYSNHALYILADDLNTEWEKKKATPEFEWCKGKRKKFFIWASHKYTYQNGNTFTAKGLQLSLNTARSRGKTDSPIP